MLKMITFILGIMAFILTSLQVREIVSRDIPYALIVLAIMGFMWGINSYSNNKKDSMKLFLGAVLCSVFSYIWIF